MRQNLKPGYSGRGSAGYAGSFATGFTNSNSPDTLSITTVSPGTGAKGMPPAPLSDQQTHALWTSLNSMPAPAHPGPDVPAVVIFK